MYWAYILQSEQTGKYYVGSTNNLEERLRRHNAGRNTATKSRVPWKVIYQEDFTTKHDAYRREVHIKRYKGGEAFKKLLK